MAEELLRIENISRSYGEGHGEIKVLDNVSLSAEKGEFIAILGPSGSGKSTLLNIAGLIDHPSSGRIIFEGEETTAFDEEEKADVRLNKIGFVFQFDSLLPEFSLIENVDMPALLAGKPDKEKAMEFVRRLGLDKLALKMPSDLSGGEKQRGTIARALRNSPKLLLADEPTGNLDAHNTNIVLNDFRALARAGVTTIMATHNQESELYADRVFHLVHGTLHDITPERREDRTL